MPVWRFLINLALGRVSMNSDLRAARPPIDDVGYEVQVCRERVIIADQELGVLHLVRRCRFYISGSTPQIQVNSSITEFVSFSVYVGCIELSDSHLS